MQYIPCPDFPTGGTIIANELIQAYKTGRGKIAIRAKLNLEQTDNGKTNIVITELPYQVNKAQLLRKIAELREEKKEELEEAVEDVKEEIAELVEDEDHDEDDYEDEFLSLEELLVCIVTENLYILIWPKPYYILDRRCFEEGKDAEFRAFIEEHARIIEA